MLLKEHFFISNNFLNLNVSVHNGTFIRRELPYQIGRQYVQQLILAKYKWNKKVAFMLQCHFKLVSYFNSLVQILGLQKVYTSGFHEYVSQYFPIFLYLCTNCDLYVFFLRKSKLGTQKSKK